MGYTKRIIAIIALILPIALINSCGVESSEQKMEIVKQNKGKIVVYQVFTRLFGNMNSSNKPWGSIEENGVGKFADFNDKALSEIKKLGVTHIWYTGVPHHALINDYTKYGISNDDPDVVKGRAGSPYAVKDYYNVNPDLAVEPAHRLNEFKALIKRTHDNGLKLIIDIVPNHVARNYHSISAPKGVADFGQDDDKTIEYHVDNNFYYAIGEEFKVPVPLDGYKALGGENHPLSDGEFAEVPAKWTGNGSRLSQPHFYDWYETVKINYGVRPDGTYDFDTLPDIYSQKSIEDHFNFWKDKRVPNSWVKFRDIALYWIEMGVDGFRYDMAEMVPVEFWSYMNSSIKMKNKDAFLLAEVYNPNQYRNYIFKGKMDYLYDKVDLYDTLKNIIQGRGSTHNISQIQVKLQDIEHNMLHFLENHDEQRIASPEFAGSAQKAMPAMVLSTLISSSPTMIYFGQEVGEDGSENPGFGRASRTSIFDYVGVPAHQRWVNHGLFDGAELSFQELKLREFYSMLLNYSINSEVLKGKFIDLQQANTNTENYGSKQYTFARANSDQRIIVSCNFDEAKSVEFNLVIPSESIDQLNLQNGKYTLVDYFTKREFELNIDSTGVLRLTLEPLQSVVLEFKQ